MNINYDYYRVFYYIAKCSSLTAAAGLLHSNQPNLSRIIKLMEHELGCCLFIRSNKGISLTPEGERLYSHVKIAVGQIEAAQEELKQITGLHKGMVTIGASETALHMLLPVLKSFKEEYPNVRIRIQNHLTAQAVTAVEHGTVDFAVVASPASLTGPLTHISLMQFQDILIGGTDYAGLAANPLSLERLQAYPLICLGEHTMTYRFYDAFYHSHGLTLHPELEAATTDQILPMVKSNLGLGFLPEIYADKALSSGEVCRIPLTEPVPLREIYLVENEERPLSITAEALKGMLISI